MPTITVIVPVYNVEKYLNKCLDGILAQTFTDFELILIDDGSKDRSGAICDEYAAKDDRVKVIHQENRGQAAARNAGIKLASAEWVSFIDSDDIVHPQLLEFLYRGVTESEAGECYCGTIEADYIPDDFFKKRSYSFITVIINEETLLKWKSSDNQTNDIYYRILPGIFPLKMVQNNLFIEGKKYEDNEVACKWHVASGSVAIIPEQMYYYRINPTGTMHSPFSTKKFDYLWALESQIRFYKEIGYKKMQSAVANEYFGSAVYLCKEAEKHLKDKKNCRDLMRTTEKKYKEFSKFTEIQLSDHTNNCILKYAHPYKFKLRKKLKSIFKSKK